jgi:hypothetical protein
MSSPESFKIPEGEEDSLKQALKNLKEKVEANTNPLDDSAKQEKIGRIDEALKALEKEEGVLDKETFDFIKEFAKEYPEVELPDFLDTVIEEESLGGVDKVEGFIERGIQKLEKKFPVLKDFREFINPENILKLIFSYFIKEDIPILSDIANNYMEKQEKKEVSQGVDSFFKKNGYTLEHPLNEGEIEALHDRWKVWQKSDSKNEGKGFDTYFKILIANIEPPLSSSDPINVTMNILNPQEVQNHFKKIEEKRKKLETNIGGDVQKIAQENPLSNLFLFLKDPHQEKLSGIQVPEISLEYVKKHLGDGLPDVVLGKVTSIAQTVIDTFVSDILTEKVLSLKLGLTEEQVVYNSNTHTIELSNLKWEGTDKHTLSRNDDGSFSLKNSATNTDVLTNQNEQSVLAKIKTLDSLHLLDIRDTNKTVLEKKLGIESYSNKIAVESGVRLKIHHTDAKNGNYVSLKPATTSREYIYGYYKSDGTLVDASKSENQGTKKNFLSFVSQTFNPSPTV